VPVSDIDDIDRRIVALLRQNARRSYQDMGAVVSLSAPAVKRRVDRLLELGVIQGFTAVVDPRKFGWTTQALVQVQSEGRYHRSHILAAITDIPEVVAAYTIAGEGSAILLVRAADTEHLERVLEALRNTTPINNTQTSVILSTLVERHFEASVPSAGA
jgi:DNA-binding Lrp family transcriptional regulator